MYYGYRICPCGRYSQESQGLCTCGRRNDGLDEMTPLERACLFPETLPRGGEPSQ